MLLAENIHKSYGRLAAVRAVSFSLPAGQVVGLLGPNGAGKTTTIRILTGYSPPDEGRVEVDGVDMGADSSAARGKIGYLPESTPLYPEMSVRSYLDFRARLQGMRSGVRRSAVGRAVERCWLSGVVGKRIGRLSKGYRQRVGLAAAILHDPKVIVLDEPTNGLDPTQVGETRALVRELARDKVLLFSSHVLSEVERLCDRVIIMANGRVRADGTPEELAAAAPLSRHYTLEICAKDRAESDKAASDRAVHAGVLGVQKVAGVMVVSSVPDESGWWTLRVQPDRGAPDLREALARAVDSGGCLARRLEREAPSLERTFASIIESAGGE